MGFQAIWLSEHYIAVIDQGEAVYSVFSCDKMLKTEVKDCSTVRKHCSVCDYKLLFFLISKASDFAGAVEFKKRKSFLSLSLFTHVKLCIHESERQTWRTL